MISVFTHTGMCVERVCVIWFVVECFRSDSCVVEAAAAALPENRGP